MGEVEIMVLEFRTAGFQPPSTNDMYIPTVGARKMGSSRRRAYLRSSDWLRNWQAFITEMFEKEYFYSKSEIEEFKNYVIDNNCGIYLEIHVSMPRRAYGVNKVHKNDATNYPKAIEDAIFMNIGIDDKYTIESTCMKHYNTSSRWYVEAIVRAGEKDSVWSLREYKEMNNYEEETN